MARNRSGREFWSRGLTAVARLLRRGRAREPAVEEPPERIASAEAHLEVRWDGDRLTFQPTFDLAPLFSLEARPTGGLTTVRGSCRDRPAVHLRLPLHTPLGPREVRLAYVEFGSAPDPDFSLRRASRRALPRGGQACEFVFARGSDQVRYLVEMDADLVPLGFREVSEVSALFPEVPPVAQMVAFLKATLYQRRTALGALKSMTRGRPERQLVDRMDLGRDPDHPRLHRAVELARSRGREVHPATLGALALFAEIHLGGLTEAVLQRESGGVDLSLDAVRAALAFLGVEPPAEAWGEPTGGRWEEARDFLRRAVAARSALVTLEDLAADSGSEGCRQRVERLVARIPPDQNLENDEQRALRSYLAAHGRPVHPDTLAALCIYVDLEAGVLSAEDIDALTLRRGFVDTSLYAMTAVAGAFDLELRAYRIRQEEAESRWRSLKYLVLLGQEGVIARFLEPGEPGYHTRHLAGPGDVDIARQDGLEFTGEVLARFPLVDHLQVADLEVLLGAGVPLVACFQSGERRILWRLIRQGEALPGQSLGGPFSFIDGYHLYRFFHRVVGRRAAVGPEYFAGRERVVAVYRDPRGNPCYCLLQRGSDPSRPPRPDWEWSGQVLQFPRPDGLPRFLEELPHEYLLGRPEDRPLELRRLDRIYSGLRDYLTSPEEPVPLARHPDVWERLREALASASLRRLLEGVVEVGTRNDMIACACGDAPLDLEIGLDPALLAGLTGGELEVVAALAVLFALCRHPEVRLPGRRKYFHPDRFGRLLYDRLRQACGSPEAEVRRFACRLLGSDLAGGDPERRLAGAYLLARLLEDPEEPVARSAARAMAALALADGVPLPSPVQVKVAGVAPGGGSGAGAQEVEAMVLQAEAWLGEKPEAGEEGARRALEAQPRRLESTARLLALLNEGFRRSGSLRRRRALTLLTRSQARQLRRSLLAAWKVFAQSRGFALRELIRSVPPDELYGSFQGFLAGEAEGLTRRFGPPYLGGPERPLPLFLFHAGEACRVRHRRGVDPFFAYLAERLAEAEETGEGPLQVCEVLAQAGREVKAGRQVRVTRLHHPVYAEDLLVFLPDEARWVGFLHPDAVSPQELELVEQEDREFESLLELYAAGPALPVAGEEAPVEEGPVTLPSLAEELAHYFNLPPERRRLALHMLVGLAPRAKRPLPSEVEVG